MADQALFTRHDVTFASGDSTSGAWLHLPAGVSSAPVVVLGHGLGATREMRLDAFAEQFASAGIAALAFTYWHFGDSGGRPPQLLSIKRQLADWDAAIAYVKARPEIDGSRVAVWGSSFGGGHAITVASRHPELAAAVSQCPFTDGLASALALGPVASVRLTPVVARDLAAQGARTGPDPGAARREARLSRVHERAGRHAGVRGPDPLRWNLHQRRRSPGDPDRPGRVAKDVRMPILFCVSNTDSVTPPAQTLRYARTAPRGEIKTYDAGHFEFYLGEPFEQLVSDQVEFLVRHLEPDPPRSTTRRTGKRKKVGSNAPGLPS